MTDECCGRNDGFGKVKSREGNEVVTSAAASRLPRLLAAYEPSQDTPIRTFQ